MSYCCFCFARCSADVLLYHCCTAVPGEADLMASGLPFTIIKPGGLLSTEGGRSLLLAGHDDDMKHAR